MPWTDRLSLLSAMSFRPFAGLPEFLFDALWSAYWAAYRPGCRGRQRRNAAGHPNLFDRGKPVGGRRPACARLPIQARRSVSVRTRPAPAAQVSPSLRLKVLASDSPPSLYFCRITPLPRVISGTSPRRSEEHTSELQSLTRVSYA